MSFAEGKALRWGAFPRAHSARAPAGTGAAIAEILSGARGAANSAWKALKKTKPRANFDVSWKGELWILGDPARAKIVWTLIDGTTRPAGELAYAANISAQSASGHLAKLVRGGLLRSEAQGRHRYFRIASAEVAGVIEGMASLGAAIRPRSARRAALPRGAPPQFLHARTCYGHLAGETAVRALQAMVAGGWLSARGRDLCVTAPGEKKLAALGVEVAAAREGRRVFARACVDLTQRRPHLGGALGEALLDAYVARGWIQRQRRSRAVLITPKGDDGFRRFFSL